MKIAETIDFLTQVHTAWAGVEQRAALRARPRRSVAYDYIGMNSWQSQYLRALSYSQQTQLFQIPLWHAAVAAQGEIYTGETSIRMAKENLWQYRGCSNIMLWLTDEYGGTLFPVTTMASDGILGLGKQIDTDWHAGRTTVCPVAWGVLSQTSKFTNYTGAATSMTLEVEIMREQQAPTLPAAVDEYHDEEMPRLWGNNLPASYNGVELFLWPPAWVDDMTADASRLANRLDNKTGFFRYDLRSTDPNETRELPFVLKGRNEINNMQRFFCRCKGKWRSFFAPTWLQDVELAMDAPAGQNYLLAQFPRYWQYFATGQRRKTLIVFSRNFTNQIIKVAGYTTDETGTYGKIYLETPLKQPLTIKDTLMISYLCRYRHDSDAMTTDYETVDVAQTTFTLMEVTE